MKMYGISWLHLVRKCTNFQRYLQASYYTTTVLAYISIAFTGLALIITVVSAICGIERCNEFLGQVYYTYLRKLRNFLMKVGINVYIGAIALNNTNAKIWPVLLWLATSTMDRFHAIRLRKDITFPSWLQTISELYNVHDPPIIAVFMLTEYNNNLYIVTLCGLVIGSLVYKSTTYDMSFVLTGVQMWRRLRSLTAPHTSYQWAINNKMTMWGLNGYIWVKDDCQDNVYYTEEYSTNFIWFNNVVNVWYENSNFMRVWVAIQLIVSLVFTGIVILFPYINAHNTTNIKDSSFVILLLSSCAIIIFELTILINIHSIERKVVSSNVNIIPGSANDTFLLKMRTGIRLYVSIPGLVLLIVRLLLEKLIIGSLIRVYDFLSNSSTQVQPQRKHNPNDDAVIKGLPDEDWAIYTLKTYGQVIRIRSSLTAAVNAWNSLSQEFLERYSNSINRVRRSTYNDVMTMLLTGLSGCIRLNSIDNTKLLYAISTDTFDLLSTITNLEQFNVEIDNINTLVDNMYKNAERAEAKELWTDILERGNKNIGIINSANFVEADRIDINNINEWITINLVKMAIFTSCSLPSVWAPEVYVTNCVWTNNSKQIDLQKYATILTYRWNEMFKIFLNESTSLYATKAKEQLYSVTSKGRPGPGSYATNVGN